MVDAGEQGGAEDAEPRLLALHRAAGQAGRGAGAASFEPVSAVSETTKIVAMAARIA